MNLVVDIGNSLAKVAVFRGDQIQALWTGVYEEAPAIIQALLKERHAGTAIVSTVRHTRGQVPAELLFLEKEGVRVLMARPDMPLPISLDYNTTETLGTDRLAAAVAANHYSPDHAALVINAGTCLTTDLVSEKGVYLGGTIAPGLRMRLNALHHYTGNLPLVTHGPDKPCSGVIKQFPPQITPPVSQPDHHHDNHTSQQQPEAFNLPGKSTNESVLLGVTAGMIAETDGLIDMYRQKLSFFHVFLSGGDVKIFDKKLKNRIFAVENIVLHGLNQMLIYNA